MRHHFSKIMAGASIISLGFFVSCSTKQASRDYEADLAQQQQQIETLESKLEASHTALKKKDAELTQKEQVLKQTMEEKKVAEAKAAHSHEGESSMGTISKTTTQGSDDLFPPNAKPGECYTRLFIPPTYTTKTETVLVKEASQRIEVQPASYQWVEEKILVKPASERLEIIPAEYEWVEEKVLSKEASSKVVEVPAVYETKTETVIDQPAHTVWKKGTGPIQKMDQTTGEIMCLVEVPATYKTVTKRVIASPARTQTVEIPAEYKTLKVKRLKSAETVKRIPIAAEYKTVKVKKVKTAPKENRIDIPAEYKTITNRVKVKEGYMSWKEILCETNMTADIGKRIQTALDSKGYSPGPIDGIIGTETMAAVVAFQKDNGLAEGDLTLETLDKLGLKF